MKKIIEEIVTKEDRKKRIKHLKRLNELPVVLYGAGLYASEITSFFNLKNIQISDYLVDDEYINDIKVDNMIPRNIKYIEKKYDKINLFIAYTGNPVDATNKAKNSNSSIINSINLIDCRFWEKFKQFDFEHINLNRKKYQKVLNWFKDNKSRKTFTEFINAKLLYDPSNLYEYYTPRQYFPSDINHFVLYKSEVFVDCGAYTGDTLKKSIELTDREGCFKYYAFEPDINNFYRLKNFVRKENLDFVKMIKSGC